MMYLQAFLFQNCPQPVELFVYCLALYYKHWEIIYIHHLYQKQMEPQLPNLQKRASLAQALIVDWNFASHTSLQILSEHSSRRFSSSRINPPELHYDLIVNLFQANDQNADHQFKSKFIFGVPMKIYRKGNIKSTIVFLDQHFPTLLWISSQTKAFLIDLVYVVIRRSDLEFQLHSKCQHYVVMNYFEEQIPFIFETEAEAKKYFYMFKDYQNFHRMKHQYPPYFSKLIKHYTATQITQGINRNRQVSQVLKTVQKISGQVTDLSYQVIRQMVEQRKEKHHGQLEDAVLTVGQILQFMKITSCNQNLKAIFENYAGKAMKKRLDYTVPLLEPNKFQKFLQQQQHQPHSIIQKWMSQITTPLSFYHFCTHLISKKWNYLTIIPQPNRNLPLTDYFIYSSHNTFMSGDQLFSDSKVERYIEDLTDGVKCLQIDVHNDGDTPIVTHALKDIHLNKAVPFESVIKQISMFCKRNQGFDPIILSIQNHATAANRYRMVDIFFKYLGKYLFTIQGQQELKTRTLQSLKGKVIVKSSSNLKNILDCRRKKPYVEEHHRNQLILHVQVQPIFNLKPPAKQFPSQQLSKKHEDYLSDVKRLKARKQKFIQQFPIKHYMNVGDEMARVTGMFKSPEGVKNSNSTGYQCTSVTNQKLLKIDKDVLDRYCRRSFLRIYPVGTELSSGNYDPIPAMGKGAQLIALNTQTRDASAWLLMSYFIGNTQKSLTKMGYVQKPIWLRTSSPRDASLRKIQISILSEYFSVKIKFFGSEQDKKRNKNSKFCFITRDHTEAFLMFEIGQGQGQLKDCIPVRWIREGYRVITGRNHSFADCGVRVLVKVRVRIIPNEGDL